MPLVKVSSMDGGKPVLISAKSLKEVKDKASLKFDKSVESFNRKEDEVTIDDEDVFEELIQPGMPELHLIARFISVDTTSLSSSKKEESKSENKDQVEDEEEDDDFIINFDLLRSQIKNEFNLGIDFENEKNLSKASTKIDVLKTKEIDTKMFERQKKELEESIRRKEERMKELERLSTTRKMMDEEEEILKKEILKKKFESKVSKELSETEISRLRKELIQIELKQNNISKIFLRLKESEHVDMCFLIDCTGSMECAIVYVKNTIHRITETLKKSFQDLNLRFAFVGYRDIGDGAERTTVLPFTDDINSFKAFVSGVKANSGDDECEDVFGGLEEVGKLDWRNMTRVLFHVADAPCHGRRFHCGAGDSHPDGDPRGLKIEDLLQKITDLNINYFFSEMNHSTIKMIDEFNRELAELNGNEIEKVKYSSMEGFENTVAASISKSISRSQSISYHDGQTKRIKKYKIASISWNDSSFKRYNATHYVARKLEKIDDVKEKVKFNTNPISIMIANQPFDKGSIRYAFAAFLIDPLTGSKQKYVAKESLFDDPIYNTYEFNEDIAENQIIACYLADEFFKVNKAEKTLRFLNVSLIHVKETGKYYTLEEYIEGEFKKWTNNAGYVNEETYAGVLNTFSHWTYQVTNEYLVVSDLQGFVKHDGKEYLLTDPAITSPAGLSRFGKTNLGIKGIKKFFESHQCSPICKHLGLIKHQYQILADKKAVQTKLRS